MTVSQHNRAAATQRTRDVHTLLAQLLRTTGAKHAFIAQRTGDEHPTARVIARSGASPSPVPESFPLDVEPWNIAGHSGTFWCSTSASAPRYTQHGDFAAILGFESSRHADKLLVLVHDHVDANAAVIEPCMRLVSGHIAQLWPSTPGSTPAVAERAIRSLALDVANEGMLEWDLLQDVVIYSARWCEMLGLPAVSMVATPETWRRRVHREDADALFNVLDRLSLSRQQAEVDYRARHADGSFRVMRLRTMVVCDDDGRPTRILGWQSERHVASAGRKLEVREPRVVHASIAAGQAVMAHRLDAAVAQARADQKSTQVLLAIDLDGFTAISASYGQDAAAQLLESVGERLRSCLRPTDVIARYGCDEFCILVQCTGEKPLAETVSEQLQHQLSAPFRVESHDIAVSASVGIARVLPEHESATDVRRDAYAAVHHAKIFGGNQCALFDEGMHAKTKAKLRLEAELRHAIDRGEFRLHYQPIVSAAMGKLVSLEALLRWEHPVRGCLPPSEFLDALANAGLMTDVGRWIVGEACRQAVEWRRKNSSFDASISINVSPRQLLETAFVQDLALQLDASGAAPSWIEIEITEDIALGDGEAAMDMLHAIRDRGVRVRIDDFGTGYSSLSYLQRLPVSGLKIDRAFINQIEHDTHRQQIVGAIVRLAHVLGLDVVAEGVERQAQLETLIGLECDYVQGYHISRPQPAMGITAWMYTRGTLA